MFSTTAPKEKNQKTSPREPRQKARRKVPGNQPFAHIADAMGRGVSAEYIADLNAHIQLPARKKRALLQDFARAMEAYLQMGLIMEEILARLAPARLGGFYARPARRWFPLDTAAKIYPLTMKHGQMSVFRESVYLKEPVQPEILQMALHFVIKRFPSFATTVKRGVFWHYLDSAKRRFRAEPETDMPCQPLRLSASGSQSFRVLWWENRISVEFFHGLTDGTGALVFLKTLLAEYLRLMGHSVPPGNFPEPDDTPREQELADDFLRHDPRRKGGGFAGRSAAQMGGRLSRQLPCQVLHFQMDADALQKCARAQGATVTQLITALLFLACKHACEDAQGMIQIQVPVNMRKFTGSVTVRNDAMYCIPALAPEAVTDLADILPQVKAQLQEGARQEAMEEMAASALRLTRNLRLVPLAIKAPVARLVYGFIGDVLYTTTLSNLGVVELSAAMQAHVEKLDFVLGTNSVSRASCAMVTCGNAALLSISKLTADPSFEEKLYDLLTGLGVTPTVTGSAMYEG